MKCSNHAGRYMFLSLFLTVVLEAFDTKFDARSVNSRGGQLDTSCGPLDLVTVSHAVAGLNADVLFDVLVVLTSVRMSMYNNIIFLRHYHGNVVFFKLLVDM